MFGRAVVCLGVTGLFLAAAPSRYDARVHAQTDERPRLSVKPVDDFEVTGTGEHAAWKQAEWVALRRRQPEGHPYDSRFKMLYSKTGLYFLMDGTDRKLTATMNEDFMDLWNEDVFEVFLWTDERYPVYFEYEISPLNRELAILVPNFGGQFLGWRPWHYEKDRLTRKATQHRRRTEAVAGRDSGLARGVLHSLHAAEAAAERAAEAGHALARQLLPHGSRRWQAHAVGVGAGRPELPRVPRSSAICCSRIADDHERHSRRCRMWSRRRFLETVSALPLVGGFIGASAVRGEAAAASRGAPDYFRELGVRPFINAAGTYTAMTASLMPPEVMDAINYASKHFVMLDELHDQGRRADRDAGPRRGGHGHLGRRVGPDARHGGRPHRHGPAEDGRPSQPRPA